MFNDTDHSKSGKHTDSVGFCFFPEDPDDAIRWLSGIVNDDVCVTFDVPEDKVRVSRGRYIDHDNSDESLGAALSDIFLHLMGREMENCETKYRTEYCCTEYDNQTFKLVGYKYSDKIITGHKLLAEWERPKEEMPDGVLAEGTLVPYCIMQAYHKIFNAIKGINIYKHAYISFNCESWVHPFITLPDGRYANVGDKVTVRDNGLILINGKLMADGFPRLTFSTGCSNGACYGLEADDGTGLIIPKWLFDKYKAAMNGEEFNL